MHFFSSPRTARPTLAAPIDMVIAKPAADAAVAVDTPRDGCGWYDSSFDLTRGLEVSEQDSDLDYQLCRLLC